MHALFITFFSFVAYATGIVAVQRWSNKTHDGAVRPVEVLLGLAVVVCGMFLNKPHYSLQYLAFCLFVMFSIGAVIGIGVLLSKNRGTAGTGEYSDEVGGHGNLSLWKQWLNFSRASWTTNFACCCWLVTWSLSGHSRSCFEPDKKRTPVKRWDPLGCHAATTIPWKQPGDPSR